LDRFIIAWHSPLNNICTWTHGKPRYLYHQPLSKFYGYAFEPAEASSSGMQLSVTRL
jgi:hypothetical protein